MNKHIELARDLRKRINHAYATQRGTESYERRECAEAIEDLVQRLQAVEAQRDELLSALEDLVLGTPINEFNRSDDGLGCHFRNYEKREKAARTAIAKAKASEPKYDQQALELCESCGWKTMIPGEGCLNCERNQAPKDCGCSTQIDCSGGCCKPAHQECHGCRMAQKYIKQLQEDNHKILSAPKREWACPTDEQAWAMWEASVFVASKTGTLAPFNFVKCLSAKLKELNHG
jgi:hypothetical protein